MVIEQYTITTTPKYNFPQPTSDLILPERFTELSLISLRQVGAHIFQMEKEPVQDVLNGSQDSIHLYVKPHPLPLSPRYQKINVSAVDTSTIRIGETATGLVFATRGTMVWKENQSYRYKRIGPFIFHLTEENKDAVYNNLEGAYFNERYPSHQAKPTLLQMPTRLASLLERFLQTNLARTTTGTLILIDGSLTSGTTDTPMKRLQEILSIARRNNNTILAFSKATSLRSNGYIITDLQANNEPPYLLEASGLPCKPPFTLLGDVYVARLSKTKMAFRLDIDHEVSFQSHLAAVEKLLGNDAMQQGYPETLRLAHILCTFTSNEVLAMQHFITRKHGIQIINRPDMHRLLFGPFGREGFT